MCRSVRVLEYRSWMNQFQPVETEKVHRVHREANKTDQVVWNILIAFRFSRHPKLCKVSKLLALDLQGRVNYACPVRLSLLIGGSNEMFKLVCKLEKHYAKAVLHQKLSPEEGNTECETISKWDVHVSCSCSCFMPFGC